MASTAAAGPCSLSRRDHQHVGFVLRRVAARSREVFEAGDGRQLPSLIERKFDDAVHVKRDWRHAGVVSARAAEGDGANLVRARGAARGCG